MEILHLLLLMAVYLSYNQCLNSNFFMGATTIYWRFLHVILKYF